MFLSTIESNIFSGGGVKMSLFICQLFIFLFKKSTNKGLTLLIDNYLSMNNVVKRKGVETSEYGLILILTSNPLSRPSLFRKTSNLLCRERKLSILLCHEQMLSNLTTQLSFYIILDMFPWTDFLDVFSRLSKSP